MLLLLQDDTENQTSSEKKEGTKKKKHRVKTVELPIEAHTHGYSQTELNNYMELEVSESSFCGMCQPDQRDCH
jgi:hypothetical protein